MRSQNRKDKDARRLAPRQGSMGLVGATNRTARVIGRASCLGMLGLSLALFCPACESASALTSEELASGSLTSSVSISFAPASGNTTLTPTNASGVSGLISVLANVGVTNSGGYSVYLGSSSSNLVGKKNNSVVIPGVSGEVSFDNLQDNTWGYTATEGAAIPEGATYRAVATGQGNAIYTNNNSRVKDEKKTFALGFAAKIDNSLPADTYENQVTLSVVSSPYQLTLMDIDNMQDMTSAICENSPQLATKQLKDVRDGKYYWVTKLADDNCWMTQNLDLDLSTEVALTPEDSDVKVNWTPEYDTATVANAETVNINSQIETRSWSLGDYYIAHPNDGTSCGSKIGDTGATLSTCKADNTAGVPNMFVALATPKVADGNTDAHYLLGNHYQWNTATAGTGGSIVSGQASGSVCPQGWRLPTSGAGGELEALVNTLDAASSVDEIVNAPFYGVRGGDVSQYTNTLFVLAGSEGSYWSSTPLSNGVGAYLFYFIRSDNVRPLATNTRDFGLSVRCIAR